jgi:hypothetical protein
MKTRIMTEVPVTRRAFLGGAAALAACAFVPGRVWGGESPAVAAAPAGKPNSVFGGVRIGCITYSYRGDVGGTAEDTLKALIKDGLSEVELMGGPIQSYMGKGDKTEQLAKCQALRKLYNDAGVNIHIHKIGFGKSDEEIDFNFQVAKALGCVGITTERNEALAKKLAPFAEKHKIWVAFHNHTNNYPVMDKMDPILECGPYIGFNFDVGHYFAGTKGLSDSGAREVPRPHHQPSPERPDRRRREPAVGPGQDADQGNSPTDEEREVDVPRRHRTRI